MAPEALEYDAHYIHPKFGEIIYRRTFKYRGQHYVFVTANTTYRFSLTKSELKGMVPCITQ